MKKGEYRYLPSFNPALKKIAEYILGNPHEVKLMRVKDLAGRCGVSEATVIRFVHALGLTGFQEMKIVLTEITSEKPSEKEFVYNDVTSGDSIDSIIKTILLNLNTTIQDTNALIEISDVKNAIEALRQAEKIDIYAAGSSYVSGEHARIRLYRIGKRCITYCDPSQQSVSKVRDLPAESAHRQYRFAVTLLQTDLYGPNPLFTPVDDRRLLSGAERSNASIGKCGRMITQ